jgi:hypothetical protein
MAAHGVTWIKFSGGPGSRVNGADLTRSRLLASTRGEGAGLYFFSHCTNSIRLMPRLPRNPLNVNDIDTSSEDHLFDALRNRVLYGARGAATVRQVRGL